MAGTEVHLTDENFDAEVADGVVLVDLWAPWCGPCLIQGPILKQVATAIGNKARIAKLNVEDWQATAAFLEVQGIPTLILFKDGREIERFVGVQRSEVLVSAIEAALAP